MKFLFECAKYLPHIGGPEISTHNLAKELIKQGHEVHVVCEDYSLDPKDPLNYKSLEGVIIHRYSKLNFNKIFRPFVALIVKNHIRGFLKDFLGKNKFDIIISRFYIPVSLLKKYAPGTRIAYLQPSIAYIEYLKNMKNIKGIFNKIDYFIKSKIGYLMEKNALNHADIIFTRSNSMKKINQEIYKVPIEKMKIFTQGINLKKFGKFRKDNLLVKKYNLQNKKVVLSVSRLSSEKNNIGLINVFSKLKIKNKALVLIGGGPEKEILENYVKKMKLEKEVHFLGEKQNVEKFYNLGDIFVSASKQEGFPNVFLEAMASGLPIIGFHSDHSRINMPTEDIVEKSKCGFAVKDEREMIKKIDLLLGNDRLLKRMGNNAKKTSKKYSWKITAKRILETLKSK